MFLVRKPTTHRLLSSLSCTEGKAIRKPAEWRYAYPLKTRDNWKHPGDLPSIANVVVDETLKFKKISE